MRDTLKGHNTQQSGHDIKLEHQLKHIKVMKWPLFVNKPLFWWSASITLDNNKRFNRL